MRGREERRRDEGERECEGGGGEVGRGTDGKYPS